MDKAQEMAKTSAVGSFQLFIGRTISTIILAVGTIILGIFLQDTSLGLYTVALIPAATFLLFQDWGVSTALTRYCAKFRASNDEAGQRKIIVAGLIFEIATGIVLTVISVVFANFIASVVFHKPESGFLIVVSSITILMAAIANAPNGIFTGYEKMKLLSYITIVQAVVQGTLAPLLVFLGYGALGAILGYTFSMVAGALLSIVLLYFSIFRKLPKYHLSRLDISTAMKPLLNFGIPLAIGNILGGLLSQFYSIIMASYITIAIIGNNRIASNFAILLSLLSYPIMSVLFPAFSKLDPHKEKALLKTVYASSVKYTVLFVVPATLAMIVLSQPLIGTLYGDKYSLAPFLLSLSVLYNLLALFGWRSFPILLQSTGDTKLIMYLNLLSLALSIPLAFVLVPALGIVGIVIGIPASALPSTFIGIYLTWKRYGAKADLRSSARILIAAALATLAVYGFLVYVAAPNAILLFVGAIIFLVAYVVLAPLVGAINQTDIDNLRSMFSGSKIMSKILSIPLSMMEKALRVIRRKASLR